MRVAHIALMSSTLTALSACAAAQAPPQPAIMASAVSAAAPGSASYLLGRPTCGVDAGGKVAYVSMNTSGSDMEVICRIACTFGRSDGASTQVTGQLFLPAGVSDTRLLEQSNVAFRTAAPTAFTTVSAASASCGAR